MRIVVLHKWAADPQEASVDSQGRVDFSRARAAVSDYDAVAISVGRSLADITGAELLGVSVGGPATAAPMATKAALARGLDSLLVVAEEGLETAGTTRTAQLLAAAVAGQDDVVLVLAGDSSIDVGAKLVPAVLGGLLGWPVLTDVAQVTLADGRLRVRQATAEGTRTLAVTGPAVIALASDAASPKAPGMKDVMAAGRKPVRQLPLAELGLGAEPRGTLRATARAARPFRRGIVIDTADPAAAAAELVGALRDAGVLSGGRS